jgi:hypothetical protein
LAEAENPESSTNHVDSLHLLGVIFIYIKLANHAAVAPLLPKRVCPKKALEVPSVV